MVLVFSGNFIDNHHWIQNPSASKAILNGLLVPGTLDRNKFLKVLVKFLSLIVISVVLYPEGFSAQGLFSEPLTGLLLSSRNRAKITHLLLGCIPTWLHAFNHRHGLILICASLKGSSARTQASAANIAQCTARHLCKRLCYFSHPKSTELHYFSFLKTLSSISRFTFP